MPRSTPDPFDQVRQAFADLGTSKKAAFVLEATFATLGQAVAETGRRAAAAVDSLNIDAWFTAPPRAYGPPETGRPTGAAGTTPAEPPPMPATPADLKTTATRPDAPHLDDAPDADGPPKTAGKPRRPPADDAP